MDAALRNTTERKFKSGGELPRHTRCDRQGAERPPAALFHLDCDFEEVVVLLLAVLDLHTLPMR